MKTHLTKTEMARYIIMIAFNLPHLPDANYTRVQMLVKYNNKAQLCYIFNAAQTINYVKITFD